MRALLISLIIVAVPLYAEEKPKQHDGSQTPVVRSQEDELSHALTQFCRNPWLAICGADDAERDHLSNLRDGDDKRYETTLAKVLDEAKKEAAAKPLTTTESPEAQRQLAFMGLALDKAATASGFSVNAEHRLVRQRLLQAFAEKPSPALTPKLRKWMTTDVSDTGIIDSSKKLQDEIQFLKTHVQFILIDGKKKDPITFFLHDVQDSCGKKMDARDTVHSFYHYLPKTKGKPVERSYLDYVVVCPAEMIWAARNNARPEGRKGYYDEVVGKALGDVVGGDVRAYRKVYEPLFSCLKNQRNVYSTWELPLDDEDKADRAAAKDPAKWDKDRLEDRISRISAASWGSEGLADGLRQEQGSRAKFAYLVEALSQYCDDPFIVKLIGLSPSIRHAVSTRGCAEFHPTSGASCGIEGAAAW